MTLLDISAKLYLEYFCFFDYVVNVVSAKKKTKNAKTNNANKQFFFGQNRRIAAARLHVCA